MKIWWRGHACFYIEAAGHKIVTDPYDVDLGYPLFRTRADIVTISHDHWDHNAVESVLGNPQVVEDTDIIEVAGVQIKGIASFHDAHGGRERGPNTIFRISAEGLALVHLGDLGHMLTERQIEEIGRVDVLLVPVGGIYTIDARQAVSVVSELQPKVVIPMHYNTLHLSFPLASVEEFTFHYDHIIKKPSLEIQAGQLAFPTRVIVLDYLSS